MSKFLFPVGNKYGAWAHGSDHPMWQGDNIKYRAAHTRVTTARGRADQYACVDCGQPAVEWSYDGKDPNELRGMSSTSVCVYSPDPNHYEPRCKPCHAVERRREHYRPRRKKVSA